MNSEKKSELWGKKSQKCEKKKKSELWEKSLGVLSQN